MQVPLPFLSKKIRTNRLLPKGSDYFNLVEMAASAETPRQGSGRFDDQMRLQKSHFLQAPSICASALTEGENAARRIKACSEKARRSGENRSGFPVFLGNSQASPAENFVNFPRTNRRADMHPVLSISFGARGSRPFPPTKKGSPFSGSLFPLVEIFLPNPNLIPR